MPPKAAVNKDDGNELTEGLIKYATGQFDVQLVQLLELPGIGLTSLGVAFQQCSAIQTLDLSENALTSLGGIQPLKDCLVTLRIRKNQIQTLDPLRGFIALEVLHVEGNAIDSFEGLAAIDPSSTPALRALHLQDKEGNGANPICRDRAKYVAYLSRTFPHVRCIDGHYFYRDEINPKYVEDDNDQEIALPPSKPWIGVGYFDDVLTGNPSKVGVMSEKALYNAVADCQKVVAAASKVK